MARTAADPAAASWLRPLVLTLGPILAALVLSGAVLLALGVNPLDYYAYVLQRGLALALGPRRRR